MSDDKCPCCDGSGWIDTGGQNQDGSWINVPCEECIKRNSRRQLAQAQATNAKQADELAAKDRQIDAMAKYQKITGSALLERETTNAKQAKEIEWLREAMERLAMAELRATAWEDDEDVMTFRGEPIGMTIPRREGNHVDRWWPALRARIVTELAAALKPAKEPDDGKVS